MGVGEYESRYAADAALPRMGVAGANVLDIGIALEQPFGHCAVKADAVCNVEEDRAVADILAVLEIGFEEPRNGRGLSSFKAGPVDQPMCVDGVRGSLDRLEVDGEAGRLCGVFDPLIDLRRLGLSLFCANGCDTIW